jgi:hypothetical protein
LNPSTDLDGLKNGSTVMKQRRKVFFQGRKMRGFLLVVLAAVCSFSGCASSRCGCSPPIVCPQCKQHCELKIETAKEKKTCFDVECEAICIPRVKMPWEDCCSPPECARTRLVHVLVERDYECEHCHYKWTPVCCEACGNQEQD